MCRILLLCFAQEVRYDVKMSPAKAQRRKALLRFNGLSLRRCAFAGEYPCAKPLLLLLIGIFCYVPTNNSVAQTRRIDSPEVLKQLFALPAPTPRHAATPDTTEPPKERPLDFFDESKPPPDDAPIEDIVEYWTRWAENSDGSDITDPVRKRLFDYCLSQPQKLHSFLRLLPDTNAAHAKIKELYDSAQDDPQFGAEWRNTVKEWLLYNTTYYLGELRASAQKAKDDDKDGGVDREVAVEALARLDWTNAEPLLRGLLASGQPRSSVLALSLFYLHAVEEKDMSGEERYRRDLISIAANRNQLAYARSTAIEALSESEWSGRDEWYLALFQDETLLELGEKSYTFSPFDSMFLSDTEKWTPIMVRLLESKDINVRSAAASCLLNFQGDDARKDALAPLLPWLSNPMWLKDNNGLRLRLIQSMANLDMPESVPGLIAVVSSDHNENLYERSYAAKSLAKYKDPRAVPALKKALASERDENERQGIIEGLLGCQGLSDIEQAEALEAYAAKTTTEEGRLEMMVYRGRDQEPLPIQLSIGKYFAESTEAPASLVNAVLARADTLKSENPSLSKTLLEIAHKWQGSQIDLDLIRRIANGSADADTISKALSRKSQFHESLRPEMEALSAASGATQGVGAVLLEDSGLAQGILISQDQTAQIALLGSSRFIQMPLPVELVSPFLRSKNSLLATAAEAYLLAEDSLEAREVLWQLHPNEAFVTGWRDAAYLPVLSFEAMNKAEEKLRAELLKENGPSEVLALVDNDETSLVLRLYGDKAVFTQYEDATRYRERTVPKAEVATLKDFLTTSRLPDRGPTIEWCHHGCPTTEYLALTKEKGRRVFAMSGYGEWTEIREKFALLGAGAQIHYNLEKDIKGLEVLYANDGLLVKDVSQQGNELRVFVERVPTQEELQALVFSYQQLEDEDEAATAERRRRETERFKARFTWHLFANQQLGAVSSQPDLYSSFDSSKFMFDEDQMVVENGINQVQVLTPDSIVFTRSYDGMWKQLAGAKPVRLTNEGAAYSHPIVTPDGKWIVASKADDNWSEPNYVVRYSLQTGREFRVKIDPADQFDPLAFVAAHNKVLLRRAKNEQERYLAHGVGPDKAEYYLLTPSTGETQLVKGDFEPLRARGGRSLQRTEKPDEFWAAIPDVEKNKTRLGRYNTKDFSFKLVMEVPHIAFDSLTMWVDASQAKVYVVYKGQLLRLPLHAAAK